MTREHKISLVLGFAAVLVVGILVSDHLSGARRATLDTQDPAAGIRPLASTQEQTRSDLVLVDEQGRIVEPEVPLAPATDERQSGLEWLGDRARTAMDEFAGGGEAQDNGAQIPTIDMGAGYRQARTAIDADGMSRFTLYAVKPGDTLWALAQRFLGDAHRYHELEAINRDRLGAGGALRAGATIRIPIPAGTPEAKVAPDEPAGASASKATGALRTYKVKPGDTLSEIAQEMLGTIRRMDEILKANTGVLGSPEKLRVGMELKIPPR